MGRLTDPKGHPYKLMPDGRIEVQDPQNIYFITKGLPPGAAPPQPPRVRQGGFEVERFWLLALLLAKSQEANRLFLHFVSILACPQVSPNNSGPRYAAGGANTLERRELGRATFLLLRNLWSFLRESTPERRRQRYGDMEYDWENRVNTTSGTVGWRARLLGVFHSPYQPTEPSLFREMMASLPIAFDQFTFVDLGSGKGRTLLMASEYPFRKIVGVELIAELHRAAEENIRAYHSATQRCSQIEAVCADACEFPFPADPLVLYLFNPLPESGLRRLIAAP